MENIKREIEEQLAAMAQENDRLIGILTDAVRLTDYSPEGGVWTKPLQRALKEHEIVMIPSASEPYRLDGTVILPSNRRIVAEDGAVIRLEAGVKVLMLRNADTADGTHSPITGKARSVNVSIEGGVWEESCTRRMGYGDSGMYDGERSLYGVSTCMFFENIEHLTLRRMTFRHCGGFALQLGEVKDAVIEHIRFDTCYADGVHVNGNAENILVRDVRGRVGDDLVAFNMFDWQDSSVNFGPCRNVLCEDLELSADSQYKALRIEPGVYTFDDGTRVDCSLTRAIFRHIQGIKTFKLYCQTPVYGNGISREPADVGSGDHIFFEDIRVDLDGPIDRFDAYENGDPVTGSFAAFELGLNVKNLSLRNVDLTLHRERYPYSYLLCIGPKSVRLADGREIFDPHLSSVAERVYLENITVNGERPEKIEPYLRQIVFDHLYPDMSSTAEGRIGQIVYR